MAMTIEEFEKKHVDEKGNLIQDKEWFYVQSSHGTEADRAKAYDENGNFHCIHWWNCTCCPAFNSSHCI